jgi:hypothetical protein
MSSFGLEADPAPEPADTPSDLHEPVGPERLDSARLRHSAATTWDAARSTRPRTAANLDTRLLIREESLKLVHRVFLQQREFRLVCFADLSNGTESGRICAATAHALADCVTGAVCLVDATIDPFPTPPFFDIDRKDIGDLASDTFRARTSAQQQRTPSNLWLLPCKSLTSSQFLLRHDRLRSWVLELQKEFDYVLFNAPAVHSDGRAAMLAQLTDGLILVVEESSTRREVARKAKETLEEANVRLLGAVLSNRTFPIPEYLYRKL